MLGVTGGPFKGFSPLRGLWSAIGPLLNGNKSLNKASCLPMKKLTHATKGHLHRFQKNMWILYVLPWNWVAQPTAFWRRNVDHTVMNNDICPFFFFYSSWFSFSMFIHIYYLFCFWCAYLSWRLLNQSRNRYNWWKGVVRMSYCLFYFLPLWVCILNSSVSPAFSWFDGLWWDMTAMEAVRGQAATHPNTQSMHIDRVSREIDLSRIHL